MQLGMKIVVFNTWKDEAAVAMRSRLSVWEKRRAFIFNHYILAYIFVDDVYIQLTVG